MSWEAVTWANKQRLRLPQEQLLLLLIANAADPDGMAFRWWRLREHWWTYLRDRSRQSRASVFRHLNSLEDMGLIQRQKVLLPDGTVRFECECQFNCFIDVDAEEAETQSHGETQETEGESHGETDQVAAVRLSQSQSCDSIKSLILNPTESKSPPTPQGGSSEAGADASEESEDDRPLEGWIEFKTDWEADGEPIARVSITKRELRTVSAEHRPLLQRAVKGYLHHRKTLRKPPGKLSAQTFIREMDAWETWAKHAPAPPPPPAPPPVFVEEGTEEWRALCVIAMIAGDEQPKARENMEIGFGRVGRVMPRYMSDIGLVLGKFDCSVASGKALPEGWRIIDVKEDFKAVGAWRERIHTITGRWIEPRNVFTGEMKEMEIAGERRPWKVFKTGLPVPDYWPPPRPPQEKSSAA